MAICITSSLYCVDVVVIKDWENVELRRSKVIHSSDRINGRGMISEAVSVATSTRCTLDLHYLFCIAPLICFLIIVFPEFFAMCVISIPYVCYHVVSPLIFVTVYVISISSLCVSFISIPHIKLTYHFVFIN